MRPHDFGPRPAQLKWLLNSDPAIRWQVMRDLTEEAPAAVGVEALALETEELGSATFRSPISRGQLGWAK